MTRREEVIGKICEFAEDEISSAGCRTVDRVAHIMVRLLEHLGEEEAALRVYEYYNSHA